MIETAASTSVDPDRLEATERPDFLASYAFTAMHLGAAAALFTGIGWVALSALAVTLWARMFGITAGYHRYFAHRSFRTSRGFQFALAWLGASAGQNGPLWWVSHHRMHHRHADTENDVHPPGIRGLWWAHAGWILSRRYKGYDQRMVRDLARYPELRFLEGTTCSPRPAWRWRCSRSAGGSRCAGPRWGRPVGSSWAGASS